MAGQLGSGQSRQDEKVRESTWERFNWGSVAWPLTNGSPRPEPMHASASAAAARQTCALLPAAYPARRLAHIWVSVGDEVAHAAVQPLQQADVIRQGYRLLQGRHGGSQVQAHVGHWVVGKGEGWFQQVHLQHGGR